MKLPALAAACVLAVLHASAWAQEADEAPVPLVTVNAHTITSLELSRQLRIGGLDPVVDAQDMSALEREEMEAQRKRLALRDLIDARLLYDQASREYLSDGRNDEILETVGQEQIEALEERAGSMLKARLLLADPMGYYQFISIR